MSLPIISENARAFPVTVLLADSHAMVRTGIALVIDAQADMEVVAEAGDGQAAIDKARQFGPKVVVMEAALPGMDGPSVVREIKRLAPSTNVLTLSVHEDTFHLRAMLEAGASGYMFKRSPTAELICALRAVAGGTVYLDPLLDPHIAGSLIRTGRKGGAFDVKEIKSLIGALSQREVQVLRALSLGYANKEIAEQLDLSVKTVETYRLRGMEKLGSTSRLDLMRYAQNQHWLTHDSVAVNAAK